MAESKKSPPSKYYAGGYISSNPPTPPPVGAFKLGLNLSGPEDAGLGDGGTGFATLQELQYWVSKGITFFRIPLSWFFFQSANFSSLNTTYCGFVSQLMANAATAGATLLLDMHNGGIGPGGTVGNGTPISAFVDLWTKLSTFLRADPHFAVIAGYDLMNEWNAMDPNSVLPSTPYSQNLIFNANQSVVTALRSAGDNTKLYLEWDHFSGAWDAVTNNISMLMGINDPVDNNIISVHCYLDNNSSGLNFVWAQEIAKPGVAPPGLATNVNIGPERMAAVTTLAAQMGKRLHLGETGWGNDLITYGGNDDYADWNQAGQNMLQFCHDNKIEVSPWGAGPGFSTAYGYNPEPSNVISPGQKDFTTAGLQSTQTVILEKFSGYTGSQPTTYRTDIPLNVIPYAPSGTAIPNFKLRYNGKISSPITFTGAATLTDGTNAGGTFSPISLPIGDNGISTFSYTPASTHKQILLNFTNNAGLTNAPTIGCSSLQDLFTSNSLSPVNVYALRASYFAYVGPALKLQRVSDNAQQDFYFNVNGDLPRQAIQDWAGSRLIPIVTIYDQSPNGNNITYGSGNHANLSLSNAASYPEVVWGASCFYSFQSPVNGDSQQTVIARVSDGNNGNVFIDQSNASTSGSFFPFRFAPSAYGVNSNSPVIAGGREAGVYHTYGGTFIANTTNGLTTYKDGTIFAQANTPTGNLISASNTTTMGYFVFFTATQWTGSWTNLVILNTAVNSTVMNQFVSSDTTYYSTPLPDSLSGVNPTIAGTGARSCIVGKTSVPFAGVTISDTNGGGATDTVTLTLTGTSGGTLTGTGITGTGPYTIASNTPANVTTTLQGLTFTPSGASGTSTTVTIGVVSSAGTSASNSSTVIAVQAVAPAETPFAAPSGTFTPINKSGPNIIAADSNYPDAGGFNHIYPQNDEIDYWASTGCGSIRVPLSVQRLQPSCYGLLDPPKPRADGDNYSYNPPYSNGTQVNLAEIKRVLDHARGLNMYVQLEFHQNVIVDTQNGIVRTLGNDTEATNIAVDLWQRMATVFKNYDNAIFEYFNEPVASTAALNFTCMTTIAAAVAAITTLQWNYIPTNFFSGGNTYVSRGEPTSWNSWTPPAGLKWALVVHQYLNAANDGFTADVVLGKGASALSAAITSMRSAGIKAVLTETGWSPSDTIVSPGTGVPSTEGNAILNACKTNNDVMIGWNYWLGGNYLFQAAWNAAGHSVFSAVPQGLHPVGTIVDAPQTAIMQANFI